MDSLKKQNGTSLDRPLPNIPKSVSDDDLTYENSDALEKVNDHTFGRAFYRHKNYLQTYVPGGPLPVVPAGEEEHSEEDELDLQSEGSVSDQSDLANSVDR